MSADLLLLRWVAIASTATLTGAMGYFLLRSPQPPVNYLGIRGMRRVEAQRRNQLFAAVEPVLRWLGGRLSPLMSASLKERARRQIVLSGDFLGLLPEELVALSLLGVGAGMGVGVAYAVALDRGIFYVLLGGVVGGMLPYMQFAGIEQERRKRILRGIPHLIDLLSLGLSAGLDLPGALRQVVDKSSVVDDPLMDELKIVLRELQLGKTRKQALLQFAERAPLESVRELVAAIVQAEERGNPVGQVLQIQAEASRQGRSVRAEEAASKAGVKMLGPMLLIFGAVLLLIVTPMALQLQTTFPRD